MRKRRAGNPDYGLAYDPGMPIQNWLECPLLFSLLSPAQRAEGAVMGFHFTPGIVARMLGVRPGIARALWGNPTGSVSVPRSARAIMLAAVASPPDWLPSDVQGWRMLRNAVEAMGQDGVVDWTGVNGPGANDAGMALVGRLVHRCGRHWPGMFWYPVDERFLVRDTVRELGFDMLDQLVRCEAVHIAQYVLVGDAATLGSCFLHHPRHPDAVRRITQRHHERLVPTATGKAVPNAGTWTPFFLDVVWRHADGSVRELLSHDQLSDEGRELAHCVGSYGYDCASGQARIYGLRDAQGRSVSTAMLALDNRGRLSVIQHSARNNRRPSRRASRMLADFVSHCELPGTTAADVLQPPEERRAPDTARIKVGTLLEMAMGAQWHDADVMAVR